MIISAYAGTGKTMLAAKYPEKFIDFVSMPYKYYLKSDCSNHEACKGNFDNIMQEDWPYNYIKAIKDVLTNDNFLLIPSDIRVLSVLQQEDIPYILCYPNRDAKEVYRKRYLDRGNTESFIEIFIDGWDRFLDHFEKDNYGKHVILQSQEFLSDVVDEFC